MTTALIVYCVLAYLLGALDAHTNRVRGFDLNWKDVLFFLASPVTLPIKMVVILWVLVKPPFW